MVIAEIAMVKTGIFFTYSQTLFTENRTLFATVTGKTWIG